MPKTIEQILAAKPEARPRIYAYAINDAAHKGLLKVGQTTRNPARAALAEPHVPRANTCGGDAVCGGTIKAGSGDRGTSSRLAGLSGDGADILRYRCELLQRGLQVLHDFAGNHFRRGKVRAVFERFVFEPEDVEIYLVAL